jgi:diguanylate cyclase (GGDEF)-like protein/PAS domain S-box-containing protein
LSWASNTIKRDGLITAPVHAAERIGIAEPGGPKHAMTDSQALAQSTIDALSSTICVLNETGTIIAVNQAWKDFAEANRIVHSDGARAVPERHDQFGEGANYLEVCDRVAGPEAAEAAEFSDGIRTVLYGESEQYSKEYACHSPDEKRWFIARVTRFFTNCLPRVVIEHINISARKQSEALLKETADRLSLSEAHYRTVFQTSLDCIGISRLSDGKYIDVNKAYLDLMGYEREEVIGRTSLELDMWADPRDRQSWAEVLRQNSSFPDAKTQFRKRNGEIFWVLLSASVIEIHGDSCLVGVLRDISNAKAAEDEIRDLAFYDPLTHLPNRRLLVDRLHQTMLASARTNRKNALLLVGLDNLKTLNDTLGHQIGDLLLQDVGRRLTSSVREADTVARLGGDEFVVMLEYLSEERENAAAQAKTVGEKILAAIGQPYLLDGRECLITSSIGVAVFGGKREGANEVLQWADVAMHHAKMAGRNTICFFAPALQAAVNARAAIERDLRQGIETNQFVLYYQPQIERGRLIGAEALLRWKHPRRGILLPGDFISSAEETGLILPLGAWVLETACRQIAAWAESRSTADISVAVNISALQLRQPDFVEAVLAVLDHTRANPENLDLELTESFLIGNVEDVIGKMNRLKSHGVRFSMDDFGTGYSSLSYLKRLPLDQLKIDRSFVRDILVDTCSGAIAQSIISLGGAMGFSVIAEGVESEEQRVFLALLGCQAFQGYLCSRPLPLEEFQLLALRFAGVTSQFSNK